MQIGNDGDYSYESIIEAVNTVVADVCQLLRVKQFIVSIGSRATEDQLSA